MRPETGYPHEGRLLKGAMHITQTAYVTRAYSVGKKLVIDCVEETTGQQWFGVDVLVPGGAGPDAYDHAPTAVDPLGGSPGGTPSQTPISDSKAALVVLLFRGHQRKPLCIGSLSTKRGVALAPGGAKPTGASGVRSTTPATTDRVIANGGTVIIIDEHGSVTIDTTKAKADPTVRIQLPPTGVLAVSRDDDKSDWAVLATPLLDYCAKLEAVLANVLVRLAAIEAIGAANTVPGGPPAWTVPLPTVAAGPTPPVAATGDMRAATLRLPKDAE